ncbi:MAG: phosphate starvation-inducible protein PhoH [Myxococcales bacterium]|nr:MAG: phosphate starvation-inducible protein PhoH [Myxococcales bacterium]
MAEATIQEILSLDDNEASRLLFGQQNENLKLLEKQLGISIHNRGGEVILRGRLDDVKLGLGLLNQLYRLAEAKHDLRPADVSSAVQILKRDPQADVVALFSDKAIFANHTRHVSPRSLAQKQYVEAIRSNDLIFAVGPAGTGKTYLAVAMGVAALMRKEVKRIILTRPAVEAGEKLGFLPGDIIEKVNPYLRPLYDALYDMVDMEKAQNWMQSGIVEVAPIAFMRGRTLNDSFIILDEAQNTTPEQMKMFLTRMGFGSKAVVTGDITQVDLPNGVTSGLIHAVKLLENVEGIAVSRFTHVDVVRHPIVQLIIQAYDARESGR